MNEEQLEVRLEGGIKGKREGSPLGNGGELFGFILYDKPGAMEELARQGRQWRWEEELRQPDGVALLLVEEPKWVLQAVRQVVRVPHFPLPVRMRGQQPGPVSPAELVALLAVATAVMRLTPESREQEAEVKLQGQRAKAWVRAPEPLLYRPRAREVRAEARAAVEPPPPASPPPLPPLPQRKISETLLEFAQPCLEDMGLKPTEQEFKKRLEFAMHIWNAVVLDTWGPRKGFVQQMRKALGAAPPGLRESSRALFDLLVHRKQAHFTHDPRLMSDLQVVRDPDGDLRVRLEARKPGGQ